MEAREFAPELITVCFVCGRNIPQYFIFYHMAAHEEEGVVVVASRGAPESRRDARRESHAIPTWRLAPWIQELLPPPAG